MQWHNRVLGKFGFQIVRKHKVNEPFEAHLGEILDRNAIDCVLDVGANIGQFGSMLRTIGYRGRIISFEPARYAFAELKLKCNSDPEWRAFRYALGASDETREMNVAASSVFSSLHRANHYGKRRFSSAVSLAGTEEIQLRRLNTCWPELFKAQDNPRVFLKMDTQGYDLEVLRGAADALKFVHGIQTEVSLKPIYAGSPSAIDTLIELANHSYEITGIHPLTRDKTTLALIEFDCIAVRSADINGIAW